MKIKILPAYRDVFVGNPARYTVGHSYDETDEAWAELLVTNGCAEAASDGDALQELSPDARHPRGSSVLVHRATTSEASPEAAPEPAPEPEAEPEAEPEESDESDESGDA